VRPIRLTDKKFAHELFGRRPNQTNYSCVNKTAQRVLLRPWIRADQSASSISSQAAGIHSSQPHPYLQTAIRQSEASYPGSFRYKSRCRPQFVSSVVSNSTLSSIGCGRHFNNRTLQFDISPRTNWSNTPVRCPSTRVEHQSNTPVRCPSTRIEHQSNTPVRRQSNNWVRHQGVTPSPPPNTPVRRQPSSPNLISMSSLRSLWSTYLRRRRIRRRRFQRNSFIDALYVATRLWHLPLIGNICFRFIGWMWSGLL